MIMNGQFLQVNWLVDISLQSGSVFHYLSYSYWHIFTFLHLLTLTSRSTQRRGRQWYCWPCRWYGRVSMSHCPDKSIDVWNVKNWKKKYSQLNNTSMNVSIEPKLDSFHLLWLEIHTSAVGLTGFILSAAQSRSELNLLCIVYFCHDWYILLCL